MLRILGKASSINVRKVLWTCEEIGIAYTSADDGPERARNPNGLVPVIVDGDFVLWESNSIIRYLANKWAAHALLPREPQPRAEVDRWMDWQATELNTAWRYAFQALVRKSAAHTDAAMTAASIESWNEHMRILDAHFQHGGQFVTGEYFTVADVVLGLSTHRWLLSPIERPHLDAVHGYYQRLSVRPAFRAHVDANVP